MVRTRRVFADTVTYNTYFLNMYLHLQNFKNFKLFKKINFGNVATNMAYKAHNF